MNTDRRVAVVTGAAGGIGSEVVLDLTRTGYDVLGVDLNHEALAALRDRAATEGLAIRTAAADVTDPSRIDEVLAELHEDAGRIDVLVNGAGFPDDHPITTMTDDAWHRVLNVCLYGSFVLCRSVARYMIEAGHGRIINISSRAYLGNPGQANYSAAKAGIHGLSAALAKELGRHHITVNTIAPGIVDTPLVRNHPKYELIRERAIAAAPIRRMGTATDIANCVRWLASEETSFVTGDVIHVTGGRMS